MIRQLLDVFENTLLHVEKSIEDLDEREVVQQPAGIPNHALWTLGHLTVACLGTAGLLDTEVNVPEDWDRRYGYASTPVADVRLYPTKAEMLDMLHNAAAELRKRLMDTQDNALTATLPDPEISDSLPTLGHALVQIMIAHSAYHAGQLAVWRRAMGRPSAGVFL